MSFYGIPKKVKMNLFLPMENVISEISEVSACKAVQACVDMMMYKKKYFKSPEYYFKKLYNLDSIHRTFRLTDIYIKVYPTQMFSFVYHQFKTK